jgi:hypothetical protein
MSRAGLNAVLVIGASLIYLVLAAMSGRTSVSGGLGSEGSMYAAIAVDHNLRDAPAIKKLAPAFPIATALAYVVTRNVVASFFIVNVAAFAVLLFAACWLLDLNAASVLLKVTVVATLCLLGLPSLTSAFDPGQPYLLGVALTLLAVAASEWRSGIVTGVLEAGATLASPVGIVAPLFGVARHVRKRRSPATVLVYVPALLVWLAVQYWARGGAAGLLDLLRVSRVRSDAAFWADSTFILYALYFLVTALGGLTMLLWADPARVRAAVAARPELLVLVVAALPFIATAGLDLPRFLPFLLPVWLVLVAEWGRGHEAPLVLPLVLAFILTVVTQHPWSRITDTNYVVDWFPYSVSAGRASVSEPRFDAIWRVRMFIAAGGLMAFVAWRRSLAR